MDTPTPHLPRDDERRNERHVMVDIETLDSEAGGVIFAIGAVPFDIYAGTLGEPFFALVDPEDAQACGLSVGKDTLAFWEAQSPEARHWLDQARRTGRPLEEVLRHFAGFLGQEAGARDAIRLWGKGADFDKPFLSVAYRACGLDLPWGYRAGRCYRTIEALAPVTPPAIKHGVAHHALDDCMGQAALAIPVLRSIYGLPALDHAITFPPSAGRWVRVDAPEPPGPARAGRRIP